MFAEVKECDAMDCFYNHNRICAARAITVGSSDPRCETWMSGQSSHCSKPGSALVGACHVGKCIHNKEYFCHATEDIHIRMAGSRAMCATYEQ